MGLQTLFTHLLAPLLLSVTLLLLGFPSNLHTYYHILFSFSSVNLEAREIDRKAGLKGTAPAFSAIRSENPATSCFSIVILICDIVLQHCCNNFTLTTLNIELLTSICLSQSRILAKNNTGQTNPLTFQQCRSQLRTSRTAALYVTAATRAPQSHSGDVSQKPELAKDSVLIQGPAEKPDDF